MFLKEQRTLLLLLLLQNIWRYRRVIALTDVVITGFSCILPCISFGPQRKWCCFAEAEPVAHPSCCVLSPLVWSSYQVLWKMASYSSSWSGRTLTHVRIDGMWLYTPIFFLSRLESTNCVLHSRFIYVSVIITIPCSSSKVFNAGLILKLRNEILRTWF
jgi:hypothetical protein